MHHVAAGAPYSCTRVCPTGTNKNVKTAWAKHVKMEGEHACAVHVACVAAALRDTADPRDTAKQVCTRSMCPHARTPAHPCARARTCAPAPPLPIFIWTSMPVPSPARHCACMHACVTATDVVALVTLLSRRLCLRSVACCTRSSSRFNRKGPQSTSGFEQFTLSSSTTCPSGFTSPS